MNQRIVRRPRNLVKLACCGETDKIILITNQFKHKGLLLKAIKFCFWSLQEGGLLEVKDSGPSTSAIRSFKVNVYQVKQALHLALKTEAECVHTDFAKGHFVFKKCSKAVKQNDWSIGILYSGQESDQFFVNESVESALKMSTVYKNNQFEIIVCGPQGADYKFLKHLHNRVRIIRTPSFSEGGRFLITAKKNYLVKRMTWEKCVILHSRIVLDVNTFKSIPANFDVITPLIRLNSDRSVRYLDLELADTLSPFEIGKNWSMRYKHSLGRDKLIKGSKHSYIDGGCIISRKSVLLDCPWNENLAWLENEDVDLSQRLQSSGYLCELAPKVLAYSLTDKAASSRDRKKTPLKKSISLQVNFLRRFFHWIKHIYYSVI